MHLFSGVPRGGGAGGHGPDSATSHVTSATRTTPYWQWDLMTYRSVSARVS